MRLGPGKDPPPEGHLQSARGSCPPALGRGCRTAGQSEAEGRQRGWGALAGGSSGVCRQEGRLAPPRSRQVPGAPTPSLHLLPLPLPPRLHEPRPLPPKRALAVPYHLMTNGPDLPRQGTRGENEASCGLSPPTPQSRRNRIKTQSQGFRSASERKSLLVGKWMSRKARDVPLPKTFLEKKRTSKQNEQNVSEALPEADMFIWQQSA